MAEKSLAQRSFFSPEFIDPNCLTPESVPWLLAHFGHQAFPAWLFEGWCKTKGRGRDAWPALTLMCLQVLRFAEEGMSRRASVERAKKDIAWRAAMGLVMGAASPSEVRRLYRIRSQCERLVNQVTRHGGRTARSFGLGAAQLQAHLIAMRCNLGVLAKQSQRAESSAVQTAA